MGPIEAELRKHTSVRQPRKGWLGLSEAAKGAGRDKR